MANNYNSQDSISRTRVRILRKSEYRSRCIAHRWLIDSSYLIRKANARCTHSPACSPASACAVQAGSNWRRRSTYRYSRTSSSLSSSLFRGLDRIRMTASPMHAWRVACAPIHTIDALARARNCNVRNYLNNKLVRAHAYLAQRQYG